MSDSSEKPDAPDLPSYLRTILENMSAEQLEHVDEYVEELVEWKQS
jgi:hypothetical protein